MIDDNVLENKLNEYRDYMDDPESNENPIVTFSANVISIFVILIKSIVFGYSVNILFNTGWNFWSTLCIGAGINLILNYIYDLTHKK